ncbi:hypothetical protein BCR44DRAFT_243721 [Catenaria anguillulae PL171]|uniref:Uncharacterized protein n=1 Tax=Catenaria anguillulae PL171 TaxID=765915 RepID=A0A1Y2HS03_9FUNG|nr:hypothetical protein BCR44DRAFT_243721 [Catenaria anguillulae PL171]
MALLTRSTLPNRCAPPPPCHTAHTPLDLFLVRTHGDGPTPWLPRPHPARPHGPSLANTSWPRRRSRTDPTRHNHLPYLRSVLGQCFHTSALLPTTTMVSNSGALACIPWTLRTSSSSSRTRNASSLGNTNQRARRPHHP